MKKQIRNVLLLTISLCCMFAMTACGNKGDIELVKEPMQTSNQANNLKQPKPLVEFANALCDEDYEKILQMLYLPNNSILTPEDIEIFLKNGNLQNFLGTDAIQIGKYKSTPVFLSGIIQGNGETIDVTFSKRGENWILNMPACYEERNILAPTGTTISIHDKEIDQTYAKPYDDNKYRLTFDQYTLLCPNHDFTVTVKSDISDYDMSLTYDENQNVKYYLLNTKLDEKLLAKTAESAKNICNEFLTALYQGQDISPYFTSDLSTEQVDAIYQWKNTWLSKEKPEITIAEPYQTEQNISCILNNNSIQIQTKIETKWGQENTEEHTTRTYIYFVLTLDHGKYKIQESNLTDVNAFYSVGYHEW